MAKVSLAEVRKLAATDVQDYINSCLADANVNPPYLSDAIIGQNTGGSYVLEALEQRYNEDRDNVSRKIKFKLLCVRDEFGNEPQPGDIVRRRIQKPEFKSPGKPYPADVINEMKQSGTYDEVFVSYNDYVVDERGCIECEVNDAANFLMKFGVHGKTGARISHHVWETTPEPVKCSDGKMRVVYYWRFKEVDNEMYEQLPLRSKSSKRTPRKAESAQ